MATGTQRETEGDAIASAGASVGLEAFHTRAARGRMVLRTVRGS